jgi:hypothetical protein
MNDQGKRTGRFPPGFIGASCRRAAERASANVGSLTERARDVNCPIEHVRSTE